MSNKLLDKIKNLNHDLIIYYVSFVFCLGIVFQGQTKIPLTFGIVFTSFFWLIKPNYKEKWESLKRHKAYLFLIAFYIILALSYFWTEDHKTFGRLLQLKLSLLLSTLVWSSTYLNKKQIKSILFFFVGMVSLHLILDFILIEYYAKDLDVHKFSIISKNRKHYIALYTLFSFGITFNYILEIKKKLTQVILLIFSLFFMYNILIIGSRIHIIGLLILSIYFIAKLLKSNFSKTIIRATVIGLILLFGSVTYMSERIQFKITETKDELYKMIDNTHSKNTNPRVYIWPSAIKAIKESPIFGHGMGDAQHALNKFTDQVEVEFWLNNANTKLRDKNINSHSQYLEVILQVGILGLFIFLLSLFYSLKTSNRIFIIFVLCTFLSMLTESIFERQFGLVFFAFFYPFLIEKRKSEIEQS